MTVRRTAYYRITRHIVGLLSTCTLLVALSACTERPETEEIESDTGAIAIDPEAEADTAAAVFDAAPDTVEVVLAAFEIEMPSTLEPGPTVFRVTNEGEIAHNFEVEGQGIEREFETNLQDGETRTMRVDLKAGAYVVYCPVGNHRSEGMEMQLTVSSDESTALTY